MSAKIYCHEPPPDPGSLVNRAVSIGSLIAVLQFYAPMAMRPAATFAAREISVKGGHTSTSAAGRVAWTAVAIASISRSCGAAPCNFQFPAIKGRILQASTIGQEMMAAPTLAANSLHDHSGCGSAFLARGLRMRSRRSEVSP